MTFFRHYSRPNNFVNSAREITEDFQCGRHGKSSDSGGIHKNPLPARGPWMEKDEQR